MGPQLPLLSFANMCRKPPLHPTTVKAPSTENAARYPFNYVNNALNLILCAYISVERVECVDRLVILVAVEPHDALWVAGDGHRTVGAHGDANKLRTL